MDTTRQAGTPLRQRLLKDCACASWSQRTQEAYVRAALGLATHIGAIRKAGAKPLLLGLILPGAAA